MNANERRKRKQQYRTHRKAVKLTKQHKKERRSRMKAAKILAAAAMFSLATAGSALAFHSGGVAECEGCHSMHNSFEGSANVTGMTQYQSGPFLLKANDQSGSCLNCHQAADTAGSSYHISTANVTPYDSTNAVETTPGGDFAWLKKT